MENNSLTKYIQYGLFVVAGVSVLCVVFHGLFPDRFDDKSAMFLTIAVVALVIHQITKFKGFGIEIEKEIDQLKQNVKDVEGAFGQLEKQVGPGSKKAISFFTPTATLSTEAALSPAGTHIDDEDPNKGQFGGMPEANGRRLTAEIKPIAGEKSSLCKVSIKVVSTDTAKPLTGIVKIHLHPTFGRWASFDLDVKNGVAEDSFNSFGAFTIGAEADGGTTRLELDLINIEGGTTSFYKN